MSLYQEPDGTRRLLNYLLDNLAGAIKRSESTLSLAVLRQRDCMLQVVFISTKERSVSIYRWEHYEPNSLYALNFVEVTVCHLCSSHHPY